MISPFLNSINIRSVLIFIVVAFVFLLGFLIEPKIDGDGIEYLLMQQATVGHFSFDLQDEDIAAITDELDPLSANSVREWYQTLIVPGTSANMPSVGGFVLCKDGKYRSYHFWFYSLCSVPFRVIVSSLGINAIYAFSLLQSSLLLILICVLFKSEYFSELEKWGLVCAFIFTFSVFYFNWIHPEVFSTCFLLVSIIRFLERKTDHAIFFVSIAAFQNQPILLAFPFFYLIFGFEEARKSQSWLRFIFPFKRIHQWLLLFVSGLIIFTPSIYYLWIYGHPNPISALGCLSTQGISLSRFISLWFDCNQGVILGFGGVMLGVVICSFFVSKRMKANRSEMIDAWLIVILCIIISIPCLIQGNWNAGCAYMLRYGLWIGSPLIISFCILFRGVKGRFRWALLGFILVLQLSAAFFGQIPAKTNNLSFNSMARWVIKNIPWAYNPDPEIFAERVSGYEEVLEEKDIFIWRYNGVIKKMLVRKTPILNGSYWSDLNVYRPIRENRIRPVVIKEGWVYLNGEFETIPADSYDINFDDDFVFGSGWSYKEDSFRWTVSNTSELFFDFGDQKARLTGLLRMDLHPQGTGKEIRIELNGHQLFEGFLKGRTRLYLKYDFEWLLENDINKMTIYLPHPEKSFLNLDPRILGVRFYSLKFQTTHE